MTSTITGQVSRDMGYTVDEFTSVLPRAMRDWLVGQETSRVWSVATQDKETVARITVAPRPDRRIASLVLPVLSVAIEFDTSDLDRRYEFMRRFDRGFQKGGG